MRVELGMTYLGLESCPGLMLQLPDLLGCFSFREIFVNLPARFLGRHECWSPVAEIENLKLCLADRRTAAERWTCRSEQSKNEELS